MNAALWLLPIATPLLGALLLLKGGRRWAPLLWLAPLPALAIAWLPVDVLKLGWLWPDAQWGITDALATNWLGFTALLWLAASLFAWQYHKDDAHAARFWGFWLLTQAGNFLLLIAMDAVSFYVGFTLMSLSAYGLVVHKGGPEPIQAGRLYVQLAILGEMLVYAALMLRIHESGGSLLLADWQQSSTTPLTMVLLLVGFGLKAGFFPLHIWLPLAHPAAPPAASAVLSGAMIKAGILGLWRFLPEQDMSLMAWSPWLIGLGLFSAFFGVAMGLVQRKVKVALAYSSISQIGYLLMILGLALGDEAGFSSWAGVLILYGVHHGLAKGALFMGAGVIMARRLPRLGWGLMAVPALALAGLPYTSGAIAKTALKTGVYDINTILVTALTLGSLATTLLVMRIIALMLATNEGITTTQKVPLRFWLGWGLLCLAPLLLPWLWPVFINLRPEAFHASALWDQNLPILLGLIFYGLTMRFVVRPDRFHPRQRLARWLSLTLKNYLQPAIPAKDRSGSMRWLKNSQTRTANARWDSVTLSTALMALFLLLAWVLI
ncbi:MAG: complex I subunit 5 family protein [Saccharospirillum sp.]|nr:complex I subunit 5 family protein [Saccharospirillum sp.]